LLYTLSLHDALPISYSYSEGNPYLQPAFTNNLELEYMLKEKFISSVYFSHTDDDFEQLSIINPETSIQQIIPKNFIINRMIGFKDRKSTRLNSSHVK